MPLLAPSFSSGATAMLARRLPTVTTTAYGKFGAVAPTAVRHRPFLRLLTVIQLRHLSQRPQDARADQPSASTMEGAQPSSKPKRQSTLDRMGATRTVKIVIIVFLCIYGTMETIFYANWLYRYLFKKPDTE